MKLFALAILITAGAFAQVPNQRPLSPQEPRHVSVAQPPAPNHLQKLQPRNKIAGPAMGQRGAGVPHRKLKKKMKNGSK